MAGQEFWSSLAEAGGTALGLGGIVFVGWLTRKLKALSASVSHVKDQVKNHHETNLRDDIDRNQDETRSGLIDVAQRLEQMTATIAHQGDLLKRGLDEHANMQKDIGGIREELRLERKSHGGTQDRLYALEQAHIDMIQDEIERRK